MVSVAVHSLKGCSSTHQGSISQASAIVAAAALIDIARAAAEKLGIPREKVFALEEDAPDSVWALMGSEEYRPVVLQGQAAKDQVLLMCFSSGTTGPAKGVESSHFNMTSIVKQCIAVEPELNTSSETWICTSEGSSWLFSDESLTRYH
jgi:4-coumarate--CoA ligase